jgi:hypothetical protein
MSYPPDKQCGNLHSHIAHVWVDVPPPAGGLPVVSVEYQCSGIVAVPGPQVLHLDGLARTMAATAWELVKKWVAATNPPVDVQADVVRIDAWVTEYVLGGKPT